MTGRRRIGPVDTIWLNMDRPNNLMVIVGMIHLAATPDWDRTVEVVSRRLVEVYPVFHQRPVPRRTPLGQPYWEDDPEFSLERHMRRVTLAGGDEAALRAHIDSRLAVPFDRTHPLWEVELIDGYGDGAAVLWRFHHALADGIALVQVLLSLTDETPEATDAGGRSRGRRPHPAVSAPDQPSPVGNGHGALPTLASGLLATAGTAVGTTTALAERGLTGLLAAARGANPGAAYRALALTARTGKVVGDLLFVQTPESPLGGTPWSRKHAVWSRDFPLDELKGVGRLANATLNDVLMSAVAGALRTYQESHGGSPVDLVTMVPVNVRPLDKPLPRELGNQFALVFFTFPSSVAAPLARLAETKRRMDWLKSTPEAVLTFGLISAIGRTTAEIERYLVNFFANKAIGVTTNVMGPKAVRYFAGTEVTGVLGWVPGSGRHTVGVSIFTYAGRLRVGFLVDAESVPDPDALVRDLEDEVAALMGLVEAG